MWCFPTFLTTEMACAKITTFSFFLAVENTVHMPNAIFVNQIRNILNVLFFKYMYIDKVEITGNPFNGQWIKPISYNFKKAYNIFYDFYRKQNFLYSCHIAKTIIKWEVWIFCFWQINTAWSYWTQSILKWCSNFKAKKITIV